MHCDECARVNSEMTFSIIIPVYNVASYLRVCLDSVLAQSYKDWEVICIDDGSNDGSGRILDEYGVSDSRIRVFHIQNGGVSQARNFGLKKAQGEYVGFIDGDDAVAQDWLKIAHSVIRDYSRPDLVRMNLNKWLSGTLRPEVRGDCAVTISRGKDAEESCISEFSRSGHVWRNFIERHLATSVEFPADLKMREDTIYMLRLSSRLASIATCRYDGYFYRMRDDSAAHKFLAPGQMAVFLEQYAFLCSSKTVFTQMAVLLLQEWFKYVSPRNSAWDKWFVKHICGCSSGGRYDWRCLTFIHRLTLRSVVIFHTMFFAECVSKMYAMLIDLKVKVRQLRLCDLFAGVFVKEDER